MVVPDTAGVCRADSMNGNVGWNRNVLSRGSKDHHLHLLMNNERSGPWSEGVASGFGSDVGEYAGLQWKFTIPRQSDRLCKSG